MARPRLTEINAFSGLSKSTNPKYAQCLGQLVPRAITPPRLRALYAAIHQTHSIQLNDPGHKGFRTPGACFFINRKGPFPTSQNSVVAHNPGFSRKKAIFHQKPFSYRGVKAQTASFQPLICSERLSLAHRGNRNLQEERSRRLAEKGW